jgi:hypothetical protein
VKITDSLINKKVRKEYWATDDYMRILFVGEEWFVARNLEGKEVVVQKSSDDDYILIEE